LSSLILIYDPVESVVQASIVIITTAAGKLQDDSPNASLDPAVTLWLIYAFIGTGISAALWITANWLPNVLPAARLAQVKPSKLEHEVEAMLTKRGLTQPTVNGHSLDESHIEGIINDDGLNVQEKTLLANEKLLKRVEPGKMMDRLRWLFLAASVGIIVLGWTIFGLGVEWGVHGNVIAGTTGE
jgi:hypothetical protein